MTITTYRNFDLLITRAGERYRAFVVDAPAGEDSVLFDLPFAPDAMPRLGGSGLVREVSRHLGAADDTGSAAGLTDVGTRLFEAVFQDKVQTLLAASLASVAQEDAGLRLRLRFEKDAAGLATLPWEILYNPAQAHFIGLGERSPILRYLALPRSRSALLVEPPLRVLAVLASPNDLPALDVEREWQAIQDALVGLTADAKFVLERLTTPTLAALQDRLLGEPVHILHFVGHGVFDEASQAGCLVLEDPRGRPQLVRGEQLAALLRNHPAMRLAYLNACEGALASGGSVFTGLAQTLVREGVPAAVAMQAEISDAGAVELARSFYTALAAGRPVDAALTQARVALSAADSPEWAIPVLFSRSPDNRLFDIRQVLPTPDCPYPGMTPFGEAQKDLFFGRDKEIEDAVERLRQHPFLTVIGPSGSGKSSLIYAGVIPALRRSKRFGPGAWDIKIMRPGDSRTADGKGAPMQALAQLLNLSLQAPAPDPQPPTFLFVDQFEETFTLAGADEAQAFLDALNGLIGRPNLHILLTVRADFYPELMASSLWQPIRANRLELTPLGDDELWAAIVEPAARVGVEVDEALAVKLIADASGQKGVLPLVQETLVLLWDKVKGRRLKLDAYKEMGESGRSGLQVAVDRRATTVYHNLPDAAQPIARRIFLRLIQFGEGRADTRRQQTTAELRASGDDPALFDQTLAKLTESRLLTASGDTEGAERRVDIAHEALIAGWPRLQAWLDQRRAAEQTRRRLEAKAAEWVAAEKRGGLLDEYELQEAENWLAGEDGRELGYSPDLVDLVQASMDVIAQAAAAQEVQRQRELEQAQMLAEEQRLRADEGERATRSLRLRLILAGIIGVAAIAFGVIAIRFAIASQSAEEKAEYEAERARAGELAANAQVELAKALPDHSLALLLAMESTKLKPSDGKADVFPASFSALAESVAAAPAFRLALPPHLHSDAIVSIAFSPQCLRPPSAPDRPCPRALLTTASGDETARLWDSETMQQLGQPLGHSSEVFHAQFSFDGSRVLTQDTDGTLYVWEVSEDRRLLQKINPAKLSLAVGLTPDGKEVVAVPQEGVTQVWSVATGRETRQIRAAADAMRAIFSPDWRTLAVVTDHDATVVALLDIASGTVRATLLIGHEVVELDFLSNEQLVIHSMEDLAFETSLWDVGDGHRLPDPPVAAPGEPLPGDFMATQFILPSGESVRFEGDTDTSSPADAASPWSGITLSGMGSLSGPPSATAQNSNPTGTLIVAGGSRGGIMVWELPSAHSTVLPTASAEPAGGITAMTFGAQGKRILTGGGGGGLDLWDAATGERLLALPPQPWSYWIDQVALSDDGSLAAALSEDLGLGVWDTRTGEPLPGKTFTEGDRPARILFVPSGADLLGPPSETPRLLVLGESGSVYLYDPLSGAIQRPFEDDCETHTHMALSQDGGTLVLACKEGKIRVWRAGADAPMLDGVPPRAIMALYADGEDGSFRVLFRDGDIWDSRRGRDNYQRPNTGLASAESAAFSPNGRQLMLTASDQMRLLDVKSGEILLNWRHGPQGAYSGWTTAAFSPDGRTVATLGHDARVRLWDVGPGARKYLTSSELPAVLPASYCATPDHADCRTIVGSLWNPYWGIPIWETSAGQATAVAQMPISRTLGVTPDGSYAVIRAADNRLCVWDVAAAQETSCLSSEQGPQRIWEMAIGNTEPALATWDERELRLWRLPDLEPGLSVPVGGTMGDGYQRLAFNPKAPILAVADPNKEVTLWDVGGREAVRLQSLPSPQGDISALAFSPDGSLLWLASGGQASSIISRWRTNTWQEAPAPRLRVDTSITALAVSPKGDRLAAGGEDGLIYLWDVTTGNEIGRLEANGVAALSFNGDGRVLFSAGGRAASVQIWPVDLQDLQEQARRLISRDPPEFTSAERRRYGLADISR